MKLTLVVIGCVICVAVVAVALRETASISEPPPTEYSADKSSAEIPAADQFPVPALRDNSYVGSVVCAECHNEIYQSYQGHPMAKSLASVGAEEKIEDYETARAFSVSALARYEIQRIGDKVEHTEVRLDRNGQEVARQTVPIHFALGSGKRGRAYLTGNDGLLFMSPVTWYTSSNQWDLSPGYSGTEHRRFSRRIVDGCLQCHSGRVNDDHSHEDRYQTPIFHEQSIGCERCHGPAESHVAFHRNESAELTEDPLLKIANLEWSRRASLCMQCHLSGIEKVPHFGRSEFDFRPGDHINDIWTIFTEEALNGNEGTFEAVSHVEQMIVSQCFLNSEGKFGCTSCHDPHRSPKSTEASAYYVGKCLQCHDQPDDCALPLKDRHDRAPESDCISCHMPKRDASDIPHTAQTDHRILRVLPDSKKHLPSTPSVNVFSIGGHESNQHEVLRAQFLFAARRVGNDASSEEVGSILANLTEIRPLFDKDPIAITAIARLFRISGNFAAAESALERALKLLPDYESALEEQAVLFDQVGDSEKAFNAFEKYFQVNPWRADMYGRHAHLLGRSQRIDDALDAATRSLELNPASWVTHEWLADVYRFKGDEELSKKHSKLRDALMPLRR